MPNNFPTLYKIEGIKKESGEVKTFKFYSPGIAKESKPGQFVMVWNPKVDEIPISIANAEPEPEQNGKIEVYLGEGMEAQTELVLYLT